jgi:hypothetical protein
VIGVVAGLVWWGVGRFVERDPELDSDVPAGDADLGDDQA